MSAGKTPLAYYREGYNCAQAVLLAHAAEWGMPAEWAQRLAAPFGAGLSGLRRTCGTLSALAMLLGLDEGNYLPGDLKKKNEFYRRVREMEAEYVAHFGTSVCRELLRGGPHGKEVPAEAGARTADYYAAHRPCEACLELAEALYLEHRRKKKDVETADKETEKENGK